MLSYRRRRDLMLKNHSTLTIFKCLCEVIYRNQIIVPAKLGRPCDIPKHKLIAFLLLWKMYGEVLEKMELDSELFLGKHYDHSSFAYHYKRLPPNAIELITWHYERLIIKMLEQEIVFHIYDSTAISTSVREERIRQGTRNKEKLTQKLHTTLGYDPPSRLVVVEAMLATDHHTSDAQGALMMQADKDWKGYDFGDKAYWTYDLTDATIDQGRVPIFKVKKTNVAKKTSNKGKIKNIWNGSNLERLYKEIRGLGEVLYGAATRAGLLISNCRLQSNQHKDALVIGLRQNVLTYLRLKALVYIIRKTRFCY